MRKSVTSGLQRSRLQGFVPEATVVASCAAITKPEGSGVDLVVLVAITLGGALTVGSGNIMIDQEEEPGAQ